MLAELNQLNISHWDAKYDYTKIESRLICCLSSIAPCDMDYWADDSITELFCDIADLLLLPEDGG